MPRRKLDAAFCAAAACPPGKKRVDYYDTVTTGFVLECRRNSGKTYYLRYTDPNGRQRQTKITAFNDVTFAQARDKAKKLRAEVVMEGDPAGRKKRKKAVPLYAELAQRHIDYAESSLKRPENVAAVINNHLVPKWGKLRLDEITEEAISRWLGEKRQTLAPATVEKYRVTLNRSFELARRWQVPGAEVNPVKGVPRFRFDNARERFLSPAEAQRLIAACEGSSNPQLKSIVQLLLLTGSRKTELLTAKWEHVSLEQRFWLIPDSKTGKARRVSLSEDAVAVVEGLVEIDGCPWLLPNPLTLKPYSCIKRAFSTAREEAKLPGLRLHDLRHSAASFMINAGVDLFTVGRILGHADHQSTMRYAHLANDTLKAAVEAGAANMKS